MLDTNRTEKLIEDNIGVARDIANAMWLKTRYADDKDSIESDAMLGLMEAVRGFDDSKGMSLRSWISQKIRYKIIDGQRERDILSRLDRNLVKSGKREPVVVKRLDKKPRHREDCLAAYLQERPSLEPTGIEKEEFAEDLPLNSDEKYITRRIYFYGDTMKAVGETMSLTESRVSQMHAKVLQKLRDHGRDQLLESV